MKSMDEITDELDEIREKVRTNPRRADEFRDRLVELRGEWRFARRLPFMSGVERQQKRNERAERDREREERRRP